MSLKTNNSRNSTLVRENFVDTADDDVIREVVYMTDREAIIDINAKSEGEFH